MSSNELYRLLGDEVPVTVIRTNSGTLRVLSNWDIYLANIAR